MDERAKKDLQDLRARLTAGVEQARSGDLAEGDGEQAIRRAFAAARARSPDVDSCSYQPAFGCRTDREWSYLGW